MKTPTLEEVKEYFKNAEQVESCIGSIFNISDYDLNNIKECLMGDYLKICRKLGTDESKYIYDINNGSYAKIISYKEPTYTITKEQLNYLHSVGSIKETIEDWFPNEFPKLEIGRWYKGKMHLICFEKIINNRHYYYGFYYSEYYNNKNNDNYITNDDILNNLKLATEQEVSEALIAEAKNIWFKKGVKYKSIASGLIYIFNDELFYSLESNKLVDGSICTIFKDGVWAEIISETIEVTLEEIAKLKGCNVEQLRIKE